MSDFFVWMDGSLGYLMAIGMVALGVSYLLDVLSDAWGEWR